MHFLKHLVTAAALLLASTFATAQLNTALQVPAKTIQTKTGPIIAETLAPLSLSKPITANQLVQTIYKWFRADIKK